MQKLSVETKNKASDAPVLYWTAFGNSIWTCERWTNSKDSGANIGHSSSPVMLGYMDPNAYFIPNRYQSTAFYFGGYDGVAGERDGYAGYFNTEGVEMPYGVYGDMYRHGYGYGPYNAYPWSASPAPAVGQDSIIYGSQHFQYPSPYFQSQASLSAPYSSNHCPTSQGVEAPPATADQPSVIVGSDRSNSKAFCNGIANWNGGHSPKKHSQQTSSFPSNDSYGRGVLSSGQPFSCYQDSSLSFDGMRSPIPWYYGPAYTYPHRNAATPIAVSSTASQNFSLISTRNPNCLNPRRTTRAMGQAGSGMMNWIYPTNLMYGNAFRECAGFGSQFYDSRMNFYGYGYENFDGLSELNRGPRAYQFKMKGHVPTDEKVEDSSIVPNREQYNRPNFPDKYRDAKFFIIKSYSEDDIHKSIKYGVWASTPSGNKKLDAAYREAMDKANGCPVFLFFSVNTSGQFVGVAEMVGPVDFDKTVDYWQQEKWVGCFNVKWHIVKDVPNSILRHITLEYNENKPVTNSRDTQEVKLEQGLQALKIFKDHVSKTSILDDFGSYETRQKLLLAKRARQQQHNKQVLAVKLTEAVGEKEKEMADRNQKPLESAPVVENSVIAGGLGESSDDSCQPMVAVGSLKGSKPLNEINEI